MINKKKNKKTGSLLHKHKTYVNKTIKFLFLVLFSGDAISDIRDNFSNNKNNDNKPKHKTNLVCGHDRMTFTFEPRFAASVQIEQVSLVHDYCKMVYNATSDEYRVISAYDDCGTVTHEENEDILFKNYARIVYKNKTMQSSLIERKEIYTIGLECRLKKNSINTIKGMREDEAGMVISPQSYEINDYASKLDFLYYASSFLKSFWNLQLLHNRSVGELSPRPSNCS